MDTLMCHNRHITRKEEPMKKRILILYHPEHKSRVDEIRPILEDADYYVHVSEVDAETIYDIIPTIAYNTCELVLTFDAFGFDRMNIDGGSYFNYTPVNVLSILFGPAENYAGTLKQRINYTISFLVPSDADVSFFREHLPHIYQVSVLASPDELPSYLDTMDWRF